MTCDTLIIGAGLAGTTAAMHLAGAGQKVVLVDREKGPTHKVCGEFLSGPAVAQLRALGVDPAAMGATPIRRLRLVAGARVAEAALPFTAYGLSRLRLDSALRSRAQEMGAGLRPGVSVRRIDDARALLGDGETIAAQRIVLATGKHDLPDHRRLHQNAGGMVGFKLHLRLTPTQADALADCIELHFFAGGYAGLQRIEGGMTNLSFVIDDAGFARAGRSYPGALQAAAPVGSLLARRLAGHQPEWERPLAVARIPYGYRIWRTPAGPDWLWPIGDQAAVIPSFTGDGMAMALASGTEAAQLILQGSSPQDLRRALRARSMRQFAAARAVSLAVGSSTARTITVSAVSAIPRLATIFAAMTRVSGRRTREVERQGALIHAPVTVRRLVATLFQRVRS